MKIRRNELTSFSDQRRAPTFAPQLPPLNPWHLGTIHLERMRQRKCFHVPRVTTQTNPLLDPSNTHDFDDPANPENS
jgi:hypothetical protein